MSNQNKGRRDQQNVAKSGAEGEKQGDDKSLTQEGTGQAAGTEIVQGGDVKGEGTGESGSETGGEVKSGGEVKEGPKAPAFASAQAPSSSPREVKYFSELVAEYAKVNTPRQLDQVHAKQVTRGLCTAFNTLGKLNANDAKVCLTTLDKAIRENTTGAFDEGVMFRHALATSKPRLLIDMMNLAKRYVSLGEGKANIGKVVDVEATADHYKNKVVSGAILSFFS